MSNVDKKTANWRLFGGGGLLLGGILWLLALIINSGDATKWFTVIGLIIMAIGFFIVAWGETGSNGAVGGDILGKIGLWAAALGTLLWALTPFFGGASTGLMVVIAILIVVGTLIAAVVIMQKGVARGLARWAMFLVFLLALLFFIGVVGGVAALTSSVITIIFAIVVALTGLLYLLNRK
ncbi:MAG: hypothetical protein ABIW32_05900 [Terrimesophilobacter sp.]